MDNFRIDPGQWDQLMPWVITGAAGMLGRLMFHAKQVQLGKRKPLSYTLLWDLPIAIGMGWIALGLGVTLNVRWEVTVSLALAVSYLGPHCIDLLFTRWVKKKEGELI